jgi:SAM-dependent methyltransferase
MESKQGKELTAVHYSKQWGMHNFGEFVKNNPDKVSVMPSRQLPWAQLFDQILKEAEKKEVCVYDAACGFGDIMYSLLGTPALKKINYIGADIHDSLVDITPLPGANFIKHDITMPLPNNQKFDFVICRAALHHTPEPNKTLEVLTNHLLPGGTVALTVYAKKAPMREAIDDALRSQIIQMNNEEGFEISREFTLLGRDLEQSYATIYIQQDLPFLGIKAGEYPLQRFIYDHFIKCWYNDNFSLEHCDLVNFDWYHPPYAYRYTADEVQKMVEGCGLKVVHQSSIQAQHYIQAVLPR